MICGTCKSDVSAGKFCANCGAPSVVPGESRTAAEVDLPWLVRAYIKCGYTVDEGKLKADSTGFSATSEEKPNFWVAFQKSHRTFTVTSSWTITKGPGMFDKAAFYKTINSLNAKTIYVQVSVQENDPTSIDVQVGFFICDQVNEADVIVFDEFAVKLVRGVISDERAMRYLK